MSDEGSTTSARALVLRAASDLVPLPDGLHWGFGRGPGLSVLDSTGHVIARAGEQPISLAQLKACARAAIAARPGRVSS